MGALAFFNAPMEINFIEFANDVLFGRLVFMGVYVFD